MLQPPRELVELFEQGATYEFKSDPGEVKRFFQSSVWEDILGTMNVEVAYLETKLDETSDPKEWAHERGKLVVLRWLKCLPETLLAWVKDETTEETVQKTLEEEEN